MYFAFPLRQPDVGLPGALDRRWAPRRSSQHRTPRPPGGFWVMLLVLGLLVLSLAGCRVGRGLGPPRRDRLETVHQRRQSRRIEVRDCTLTLPDYKLAWQVDSLPMQPRGIHTYRDSSGAQLRFRRNRQDELQAELRLPARRVTIPRKTTIIRDTVVQRRQVRSRRVARQRPDEQPLWQQAWLPWLLFGLLSLLFGLFILWRLLR